MAYFWPHQLFRPIRNSDDLTAMIDWCIDTYGRRSKCWDYYDRVWYFPNEEAITLFVLRWGS